MNFNLIEEASNFESSTVKESDSAVVSDVHSSQESETSLKSERSVCLVKKFLETPKLKESLIFQKKLIANLSDEYDIELSFSALQNRFLTNSQSLFEKIINISEFSCYTNDLTFARKPSRAIASLALCYILQNFFSVKNPLLMSYDDSRSKDCKAPFVLVHKKSLVNMLSS